MGSVVSRRPAVSRRRKRYSPSVRVSSIMARVVPCMALTMARSSPSMAFRREDFPALVGPVMATGIPSFMAWPVAKLSIRLSMCADIAGCGQQFGTWSELHVFFAEVKFKFEHACQVQEVGGHA